MAQRPACHPALRKTAATEVVEEVAADPEGEPTEAPAPEAPAETEEPEPLAADAEG